MGVTCIPVKKIFRPVAFYCTNFTILLCVTQKLFSRSFSPPPLRAKSWRRHCEKGIEKHSLSADHTVKTPKTATVAENGETTATFVEFGDSRTFQRQCGQAFISNQTASVRCSHNARRDTVAWRTNQRRLWHK